MAEEAEKSKTNNDGRPRLTSYAVIPTILCPLCFLLQFGYSIGTLNAASQPIRRFYNQSYLVRYGEPLTESFLNLLWTLSTTTFPIGGVVGSCLVSPLVANFGQRNSLIYVQVLCFLGTLFLSFSVLMRLYEAIMIGEVLLGMYSAVGLGIGPTYINDLSIPRVRGTVACFFGSSIAIGLIFGNLLALKQILGTDSGWPILFALTAVPNIPFLCYAKWLPESPRSAYLRNKNEEEAENLLTKLRGTSNVQKELEDYKAEAELQKHLLSVWQVLTRSSVRWQLISAVVVLASVQLTGINGVLYNMNNIFIAAGVDPEYVTYVSIGVSGFQLIIAIASGLLCSRFGRKVLFFAGNATIVVSIVLYTLALAFNDRAPWLSYIAVVGTLGFVMGVNGGSGVTAYVIAPEVLSQAARPAGMAVGIFTFWLSFVVVSFATPYMFTGLSFGVLLPYLVIALLFIIYVYFFVPETKEMSSLEVERYYREMEKGCCTKQNHELPELKEQIRLNTEL